MVSNLLRRPQNKFDNKKANLKQNTTVTFERTETNSTMPSSISEISGIKQQQANISNLIQPNAVKNVQSIPQKKPTVLQLSYPHVLVDYQDNTPQPQQNDQQEKKLSPATLGAMLEAELDHYIKVETEIGQVAEIVGNVQVAEHEQKAAQNVIYTDENDDSQEMEELARLDEEIIRLEAILAEKLKQKAEKDAEYYSDEYYSEYDD